jgi:Arc/MetJ-type ribon-helix-helix transcriptional regulator
MPTTLTSSKTDLPIQRTVKFPAALHDQMTATARKQERSVAQFVRFAVREALERETEHTASSAT